MKNILEHLNLGEGWPIWASSEGRLMTLNINGTTCLWHWSVITEKQDEKSSDNLAFVIQEGMLTVLILKAIQKWQLNISNILICA